MDELLELIEDLQNYIEISSEDISAFSDKLNDIYTDSNFRHSYSEIATCLENMVPEQRDIICKNMDILLDYIDNESKYLQIKKRISILVDHINLETISLSRIDKIKYLGNNLSNTQNKFDKEILNYNSEVKILTRKINNFHAQTITVLGIFSGIVITFSTGAGLASNTLSNIVSANIYPMLLFLSILGIILFNLIFVLMYSVSKISGNSIAVKCRYKSCDACSEGHWIIRRLNRKYPYVLWTNILFLSLGIITYIISRP